MTAWINYVSYFFGGVFLTNAVPHFVSGLMGRPFQSPFAKPPGEGLSSSTVNVIWGFFNLAVGYLLVCHVGDFDLRSIDDAIALGLGVVLFGVVLGRLFGPQAAMGLLALGLGLLVVTGLVQLWHVYIFAFLLGCAAAFDSPARQTFVAELVEERYLPHAVALNSTSFHAARMIGPAIAGGLIAGVGSGWVFLINAFSFVAVLCSLGLLRSDELKPSHRAHSNRGSFVEGFGFVLRRPDLRVILFMLFLVGTFGLNFPIFISTMSVTVFHAGAGLYGALTSLMAVGSMIGALLAARRERPSFLLLLASATSFGVGCTLAAVAPNYMLFGGA